MTTQNYVQSLFRDYEDTPQLRDFIEEIRTNLDDRIAGLVRKGMEESAAFDKAASELGDVCALADEISLKRRQEVFEERYLDVRRYMSWQRVTGYVFFALVFLFGAFAAAITFFGINGSGITLNAARTHGFTGSRLDMTSVFAAMLPFFTAAAAGFTWLGLTQETSKLSAMKKGRAALYALAAALLVFGGFIFPIVYFGAGGLHGTAGAIATLLPFTLAAAGLFIFLGLTEKSRLKAWAKNRDKKPYGDTDGGDVFPDSETEKRFGLFSGALWLFAIAVFILLCFTIGIRFAWLTFVFTIAAQTLLLAMMAKKSGR